MKRIYAFLAALVLLCGASWALDFGGSVENDTSFKKEAEVLFTQQDKLLFWAVSDLGEHHELNAVVGAVVTTAKPYFYADIERLSLSGSYPGLAGGPTLFALELGRFQYAEFTRQVFSQALDGVKLDFTYPWTRLQAVFGYTGLILKYSASPVLGREDALADADTSKMFANPKFIGVLSLDFPELFARQNLVFTLLVQEDLRPLFEDVVTEGRETVDPVHGGKIDTQYLGLGLSGPIAEALYYDIYGYLGAGRMLVFEKSSTSSTGDAYAYEPVLGILTGGGLRYYLPELLQSQAALKVVFASGDADQTTYLEGNTADALTAFVPVSGASNGLVFAPQSSNILLTELSYSIKPFSAARESVLESLQTVVKVTPFFKPSAGPASVSAVKPAGGAGYLGIEIDGQVNYRPFSDLGLGISLGTFVPNPEAFAAAGDTLWFLGKFLFSFSY